jgi:peroxiredoxin Q/BCP
MEIVLVVMVVFSVVVVTWLTLAQSGEPPARGKPAPEFRLKGTDGAEHALAQSRGRRAVLVFHPQDDTPECLAVLQRLSDAAAEIEAAGIWLATVVVSDTGTAQAYAAMHGPGSCVLCDTDGRVTKSYGALVNLGFMRFARKLIVLADTRGNVEHVWRDAVGPQHVDELLKAIAAGPATSN